MLKQYNNVYNDVYQHLGTLTTLAMSDSEEEEVEKPPERRAPSGRASKGSRMSKLIAEEADEEEDGDGDKEFYNQGFWADEEEDNDFEGDADDEEGRDSFDSDFGDSTESDDDDDGDDEKAAKKAGAPKKKSVYKDPKIARKKDDGSGPSSVAAPKPKAPNKRARTDLELPPAERSRGSLRASTQDAHATAAEKRARLEAEAKAKAERLKELGKKKGVELRRLTQAEILAEAAQTEIINRASLERMLRQEEDKRRVIVRDRNTDGPRIKFHSKRSGDSVRNYVTFCDTPLPAAIDGIAPPYPAPQRCVVSNAPAKYVDPATGNPYASLEAFRALRGRTGRRQHSFPGVATGVVASASADD